MIDESIEPSYRRGEWATQAELTWEHRGKRSRRKITFAVVHVPTDRVAERYLSRTAARQLVRWLARDVPHLSVPEEAGEAALREVSMIVAAVRYIASYTRESIVALSNSDWRARVIDLFPQWAPAEETSA